MQMNLLGADQENIFLYFIPFFLYFIHFIHLFSLEFLTKQRYLERS